MKWSVIRVCALSGLASALAVSVGCGEGADASDPSPAGATPGAAGTPRAPSVLTDLSARVQGTAPQPERETVLAEQRGPRLPSSGNPRECDETCDSERAECGTVCGEVCGECEKGEVCKDGTCECQSACDGTRCADDCGRPCPCASGTACDATGRCVPADSCLGPTCTPERAPEPPGTPGTPATPPEPLPVPTPVPAPSPAG